MRDMRISLTYPGDSPLWIDATIVSPGSKRVGKTVKYEFTLALRPDETVAQGLLRAASDTVMQRDRILKYANPKPKDEVSE